MPKFICQLSNSLNFSLLVLIFLIADYGKTECSASSYVNILSKLDTSRTFFDNFGKNYGSIVFFNILFLSRESNQGWFIISSTPETVPSLFAGFLFRQPAMKDLHSGDIEIPCFLGSGKNTGFDYINEYIFWLFELPV